MLTKTNESKARALAICSDLLKQANLSAKIKASVSDNFVILKVLVDFKKPLKEIASFVGALEYILRLILLKNDAEPKVLIDINNYREQRQEEVSELVAKTIASMSEVGQSVALLPMTAYDRRLVHQLVAKNLAFTSESFGMSRQRRVIIKKREELG